LLPLVILFGLNFVEQFDRVAFAALLPEIRNAFHLSDGGALRLGGITGITSLLIALPVGVAADRFNRTRICIAAGVLWSSMSLLTGIVPGYNGHNRHLDVLFVGLFLLYLVRIGSGVGQITNEIVHPSLLADYYTPDTQPTVFAIHRMAVPLGALAGPLAGVIAQHYDHNYRPAFYFLTVPTAFLIIATIAWLREPVRGATIDEFLAKQVAATEGYVPYGEAKRQLLAVRTLRRLWTGAFLLGFGALQITNILSLYFEKVFKYDASGRGAIQFVFGAGTFVGLLIGSRLAGRATDTKQYPRLALITGLSFVEFAGGMVLLAVSPISAMGAVCAFILSIGLGSYQPAYFSLVGLVAPPRVRSQAYAFALLSYAGGGLLYIVFAGSEHSAGGYRGLTIFLSIVVAIAGIIGSSAARFVRRDVEQAQSSLETAVRVREELAAGGDDRPLLVCKGVDVAYDTVQILFNVDVEVKTGEIIALLGTNGAGKSTLLKAICGLVDPIGGSIFFDGRDITHADAVQAARAGIIQVPGGKAVFPTLTVAEHFRAGTWLYADEDPAEVQARIEEVLNLFPRLRERWDQLAGNMSGGEQQQLALGMAFVAKPRLLIIDELSLGLAPTIVEQLLNIVRRIHEQGCTIILVEQSVNVALTVATRAYFMEKGEVRFSGPTEELLERGDILRSVFLQGASSVDGGTRAPAAARAAGVQVDTTAPPILEVVDLTRRFGGITAVDNVSFTLQPGQILGLIGPNGAGKTTIFDLLSGLLPVDGGRIYLQGRDVTTWGPDRRAAIGLGRSFQDARIFPSLTVAENIAIGLERHLEVRDHFAAVLNLPAVQEMEEDVAYTVEDLIELMNLGAFRDKFVAELSTGSRRIVDLAMSIAHDPSVLILDEPSSGIAQRETESLGPLLKRIQHEAGCAMLVIEHDMPLITSISDEMIALELGAVVLRGTPDEVISDPRVISSYLGGDIDVINRSGASMEMAKRKTALSDAADGAPGAGAPRRRRRTERPS